MTRGSGLKNSMRRRDDAWRCSLSLVALGALALAGCPETASCPPDRPLREGGECRAALPDGGGDAGADAGSDAGSDAGPPCGVECEAPTPHCDTAGATPMCRQCLTAEHCSALTPTCTAGTCEGCTSSAQCMGYPSTPNCHAASGECRACDLATEVELCGGNWCDPTTGACTTTPRGMVVDCAPCTSDAECGRGSFCIETQFASMPAGSFCFPTSADMAGCRRAAFVLRRDTTTVDGSVVNACMVNGALTTCTALNNHLRRLPCTMDETCGLGGICHSTSLCSYGCAFLPQECPVACGGADSLCTPPPMM